MVTPQESGYKLSEDPIYEGDGIARYATGDPTIFLETFPGSSAELNVFLGEYEKLRQSLLDDGLEAYIPEIVDYDEENLWIAYGVEEGLYTLRDVRSGFPNGLDGRDWAWMLRRMLIVLDHIPNSAFPGAVADIELMNPALSLDDILVHPEGHGIVVLGWGARTGNSPTPLERLKTLTESVLLKSPDGKKQIEFLERSSRYFTAAGGDLGYKGVLREYELKLETLYGPRRFRELKIDPTLKPILGQHSAGGSVDEAS